MSTVTPNQINHIKSAIADSGDSIVDSFVFFQGASLSTTAIPLSMAASLTDDTGLSASDHLTSDPRIHVSANVVGAVTTSENGVTLGMGTVAAGSAIDITAVLSQGAHTVTVAETDTQGLTSSMTVNLIYDTVTPTFHASESIEGLTKQTSDVLSGMVSDTNGVASVQIKDGTIALGGASITGNTWTYTAGGLSDGAHNFTATATGNAVNTTGTIPVGATVTADTTPAALTAVPTVAGLTNHASNGVSGTISDLNGVSSVEVCDGATDLGAAKISGQDNRRGLDLYGVQPD